LTATMIAQASINVSYLRTLMSC